MGLKKSKFVADTTIPSTGTLDFVANGQNLKITKENFLTDLGVTGTISQTGPVTAVPVLDISSTPDFKVRNLVANGGLTISIGPENGILIASTAGDTFSRQEFTSGGTILESTTLALSEGTHTLVMPLVHAGYLDTKSISGTITLDAGTNTFEGTGTSTETVVPTQNKHWNLFGTVWLDL